MAFALRRISYKRFSAILPSTNLYSINPTMVEPNHFNPLFTTRGGELMRPFNSKSLTEYERSVRKLYQINLFHPVKMGLANMEKLHELLGSPMDQTNIRVIHVAGTNGKGSVALKLAKTFEAAGYRTGLFVSPHISSFRERMQINSDAITEDEVSEYLPSIYEMCRENDIPATFFEVATALAFSFFHRRQAEVVVLEVGLGGRLDATNVIKSPALSIITSIGLEHTKILGDTVDKICFEKAGIVKPNRPTLVGPGVIPLEVARRVCEERNSKLYYTNDLVPPPQDDNIAVDYDVENSRIAQAALQILLDSDEFFAKRVSPEHIHQGTSQRPPCRFEILTIDEASPTTVVLDVAHNPPALKFLLQKLMTTFGSNASFRFVVGFSADKDLGQCGRIILEHMSKVPSPPQIHIVQAANPRAATTQQLIEACPELKSHWFESQDTSVFNQVKEALNLAKLKNEIVVVCGSVFIMSEAREALGIDEPRDSQVISEVSGCHFKNGQENFANSSFNDP